MSGEGQTEEVLGNVSLWMLSEQGNVTNIEQLLVEILGPRQKDFASAILLTLVYSVIFLSGTVGNICTCLVIARNHSMQTTTNYYLFSLAVSDLLLLFFGLPPELYAIWEAYPWRLGEAFCYLRQSLLEATSYASVLTITAFTVERYLAICHPLLAHKISALSRAVKIIVSIWVISLLVALPYSIHTRIYHAVMVTPPSGLVVTPASSPGVTAQPSLPVPDSLVCSIPARFLSGFMNYMFQVSTFLFFVAPVTLITILYILIGVALRRSPLGRGGPKEATSSCGGFKCSPASPHHQQSHQQPRRVVIRMLVAVTVAFVTCWAPFHAQRLMVLYVVHWTPQLHQIQSHIFYVSGVLYFVSSTVNPILYNVISKRYRAAFRQTIFPCCYGRAGSGSFSMARHSERFSRSQAVVVLQNGQESVRVIFRQDFKGQVIKDYEKIPLNGARLSSVMGDDDTISLDPRAEVSVSSNGSAKIFTKSASFRVHRESSRNSRELDVSGSSLKQTSDPGNYSSKEGTTTSRNCVSSCTKKCNHDNSVANRKAAEDLLHTSKTAEALRRAQKPRASYAGLVNGSSTASAAAQSSSNCESSPCSYVPR